MITSAPDASAGTEPPAPATGSVAERRFVPALVVITFAGLAVRLAYVLLVRRDEPLGGDPLFYHQAANLLVDGEGFVNPLLLALGARVEAADHPPLYVLFLSIPSALGLRTPLAHLLWSAFLGTGTVIVAGLLGRRVRGASVGLVTAGIVAVYPNIWVWDGGLLSETLALFLVTVALLLAYRAWDRPGLGPAVALGVTCGLAALARSELILLVPALLAPIVLARRRLELGTRVRHLAAGLAAALVVIAPWVVFNLTRFEHPVLLSSQFEPTLAGANCRDTYRGHALGYISITCIGGLDPSDDQSENGRILRDRAERFVRDHLDRVPVVVAARVGRVIGVFRPGQQIEFDEFEGKERSTAVAGAVTFSLVAGAAIAGALILRRRRAEPVFPLLVAPAIVLVTVAITYGTTRFRASAETSLAVLAAVALTAAWSRFRQTGQDAALDARTGDGPGSDVPGSQGPASERTDRDH